MKGVLDQGVAAVVVELLPVAVPDEDRVAFRKRLDGGYTIARRNARRPRACAVSVSAIVARIRIARSP